MSFQLEAGLDLGLGEAAAARVAELFEQCGEFRLGASSECLAFRLPSAGSGRCGAMLSLLGG